MKSDKLRSLNPRFLKIVPVNDNIGVRSISQDNNGVLECQSIELKIVDVLIERFLRFVGYIQFRGCFVRCRKLRRSIGFNVPRRINRMRQGLASRQQDVAGRCDGAGICSRCVQNGAQRIA